MCSKDKISMVMGLYDMGGYGDLKIVIIKINPSILIVCKNVSTPKYNINTRFSCKSILY